MGRFLEALGAPSSEIPGTVHAQIDRYRALVANRRILVVLDNVRNADQVRPLRPGSPGSHTLVTSRDQLPGLVAAEGAHPLALGTMPANEARELFGIVIMILAINIVAGLNH